MITANAIITDVIADSPKVWIQFEVEGKSFQLIMNLIHLY